MANSAVDANVRHNMGTHKNERSLQQIFSQGKSHINPTFFHSMVLGRTE